MKEVRRIRTYSIILFILGILTVLLVGVGGIAYTQLLIRNAGEIDGKGVAMIVATIILSVFMEGGLQAIFSLLLLFYCPYSGKAPLCMACSAVILVISVIRLLNQLNGMTFMTVITVMEIILAVLIFAEVQKYRKTGEHS